MFNSSKGINERSLNWNGKNILWVLTKLDKLIVPIYNNQRTWKCKNLSNCSEDSQKLRENFIFSQFILYSIFSWKYKYLCYI